MMEIPNDLRYTDEHEWVEPVGEATLRIGITDFAQDQLGDVVYVELPSVGTTVDSDGLIAEIESTKSVGEVYAPAAGEIVSVNSALSDEPGLINTSPYDEGWLVELAVASEESLDGLLGAASYRDLIE